MAPVAPNADSAVDCSTGSGNNLMIRFNADGIVKAETVYIMSLGHTSTVLILPLTDSSNCPEDEETDFVFHKAQTEIQDSQTSQAHNKRPL